MSSANFLLNKTEIFLNNEIRVNREGLAFYIASFTECKVLTNSKFLVLYKYLSFKKEGWALQWLLYTKKTDWSWLSFKFGDLNKYSKYCKNILKIF